MPPDHRLLEAVRELRAGIDVDTSFRVIDERLRIRLSRYFQMHGFPGGDTEDLVQNTLTKVFQGVRQLEHEEKFMAWLFAIARNVMLTAADKMRRMGTTVSLDGPDSGNGPCSPPNQEAFDFDEVLLSSVWTAIEQLPGQRRQCLLLRVNDQMTYHEIAETLGLTLNTVRNHLALAKKSLRAVLKTEPEGDI